MCGIAGIIAPQWTLHNIERHVESLLGAIVHRGPDDKGITTFESTGIGMRRLAIIDLDGGRQPMFSPDGSVALVFNGEIYNFRTLRKTLKEKGHRFSTQSDSEVILHGYAQWGRSVVDHLNGMFAFAIHDRRTNLVMLARDHLGVKPLYYSHQNGLFAFCSEPAPLLSIPGVGRTIDIDGLEDFLAFKYVPAPKTFIKGISKLPAAHTLTLDTRSNDVAVKRYWSLGDTSPGRFEGKDLPSTIFAAVSSQLVSDVPLGLFLSGGIDSGLLAWAASRSIDVNFHGAYTARFDGKNFDESAAATATASHFGLKHITALLSSPAPEQFTSWVESFQEPFANLSVPANFLISQWAAQDLKVVLNGSGADELFAGYDRYYASHPPLLLQAIHPLAPLVRRCLNLVKVGTGKRSLVHRARRYLDGCTLDTPERHANSIRLFLPDELKAIAPRLVGKSRFVQERFAQAACDDDLHRAIWTDMNTMLPDDYLTLVDRTSMAASLEVRVPFLDRDLVDFAFAMDAGKKMRGWDKKVALRNIAREVLPEQVSSLPKQGFESPVADWFRSGMGTSLMETAKRSSLIDLFDLGAIQNLLEDHASRRTDAAKQLLGLHTLFTWAEIHEIVL